MARKQAPGTSGGEASAGKAPKPSKPKGPKPAPKPEGAGPGASLVKKPPRARSGGPKPHYLRVTELLRDRDGPVPEHRIREALGITGDQLARALRRLERSDHVRVVRVVSLGLGAGRGVCAQVKDDLALHSPTTAEASARRLGIEPDAAGQCLYGLVLRGEATRVGDEYSKV